ncbi:hypothetical protein [Kitasatospora sp. CB02891]|uniref:hypothetical protein n=1 Tax=Kitasatospora sp. CB02891 TaxID=2020329 RepID=UPI000C27DA0A|nr:hypothetical protein [Kitasatospora sp. CB02891]PJN25651.1 hypothetical protein CG736_14830 [Kitasatospora sp. CB02891]
MSGRFARPARLGAAAGTVLAVALGGPAPSPARAEALPMDQCTTSRNVVLAIDFGRWGGPVLRACGSTPTTGYQLLNQGGWKTAGTQHDGPGFICRIGYSGYQGGKQFPPPDQEKCMLTPPATAYWSYWHADPGQNTWSYSQLGAMSYHPVPGSVDAWVFGETDIGGTRGGPSFSPDSVRALNSAPGGSGSGGGTGGTGGGTGGSGTSGGSAGGSSGGGSGGGGKAPAPTSGAGNDPTGGGSSSEGPTADPDPEPTGSATAAGSPSPKASPSPSSDPTGSPSPTASGASPAPVDAVPLADTPRPSSGSIAPVVAGVVLVAALGTATAAVAVRRRRADRE